MSSILEALRKSERERTLLRGIGFGDAGRRLVPGRDWLPWAIGAGAVAGALAVVAIVLWRGGATSVAVPAVATIGASVADSTEVPATQPTPAPASTPVGKTSGAGEQHHPEPKSLQPLVDASVASAPVATLAPATGEASFLSAMSPEFQQRVPPMTVNIHVYAPEESQRILYINNRSYRRGDEVPGGVFVEEIVPDGVVLQFQGQRFKLPRPS